MFCNKCGAQLPDGVAFCSYCGNQLTAQPQQPEQPTQPQYQQPVQPQYEQPMQQPIQQPYQPAPMPQPLPPKKSNNGIIIGIVAVVLVIAIVVGVLFGTGVIGGKSKDDGDDKDNKTTTSAQDKKDDANSNSPVKVEEAITLSDGTIISIGDTVGSISLTGDIIIDISVEGDDDYYVPDADLDTIVAPGQEVVVCFDSSTFDYSTIEVWICAENNTSSDIPVRDTEISSIELEKDEAYADETKVNLMGFTTNMTNTDIDNRLGELGYTLQEGYQYDEFEYDNLFALPSGSYVSVEYEFEGGIEYEYLIKTNNDNYISISSLTDDEGTSCSIELTNYEKLIEEF